jgi:hypothetical protein
MQRIDPIQLQETSQRQRATDRSRPKRARRRAGFASKELIQKTIRSEQRTDHNIPHVSGCYRCKPYLWLPDQGSNLGPAD